MEPPSEPGIMRTSRVSAISRIFRKSTSSARLHQAAIPGPQVRVFPLARAIGAAAGPGTWLAVAAAGMFFARWWRTQPAAAEKRLWILGAAFLLLAIALTGALLSGGCLYHMPIQQGNYLDPGQVEQLQTGMTRSQVRFLLGTPMVPGSFDTDRWDYDYYLKARQLRSPNRGHVTVYFHNDLVDHVASDVRDTKREPVSSRPVTAPNP